MAVAPYRAVWRDRRSLAYAYDREVGDRGWMTAVELLFYLQSVEGGSVSVLAIGLKPVIQEITYKSHFLTIERRIGPLNFVGATEEAGLAFAEMLLASGYTAEPDAEESRQLQRRRFLFDHFTTPELLRLEHAYKRGEPLFEALNGTAA